ncbi:MAG: tRNA pseudouridine(54/55) synthase Pus10, partial [Promethearchaeota archaeon]
MFVAEKVIEIYQQHYICISCLGRMFSLLGTETTNFERGKSLLLTLTMENHHHLLSPDDNQEECVRTLRILAENANFLPAREVLKKEGIKINPIEAPKICYLCNDIFSRIDTYARDAIAQIENFEFKHILVGCAMDPQIINLEDQFKVQFNLLESESIKSHFNREVGKLISEAINKPPEFLLPDITIVFDITPQSYSIDLIVRALFIYGRYNKYLRNIPQTHWNCGNCMGKGCELCNFTGKQYPTSVEELISPFFVSESFATDSKFHGAGR